MKYLVNFQIEIILKDGENKKYRTTYTILEKQLKKNLIDNFDKIYDWFVEYFYKNSLEAFIDAKEINKEYTVKVKVGRITNSINGKYKTFRR